MNEKYIEALLQTAADFSKVSGTLSRNAELLEKIKRYNPSSQLFRAVGIAESGTVRLRHLTVLSGRPDKGKLYAAIMEALGIEIKEFPDWVRITVPAVLPMKSRFYGNEFLVAPLREALIEHMMNHPRERYRECVICFVHQYDESLGLPPFREDYGIETKRIMDVIEAILLTNGSGLLCTHLHCVELGDTDEMRIYLMTREALPKWLECHWRKSSRCSEEHGS